MNKIVIANFISGKFNFKNSKVLFNIPIEFIPLEVVEVPVTGLNNPLIKGAINITKRGEIIFYTILESSDTIRFQCSWESKE